MEKPRGPAVARSIPMALPCEATIQPCEGQDFQGKIDPGETFDGPSTLV
jgi:hypothetical protein